MKRRASNPGKQQPELLPRSVRRTPAFQQNWQQLAPQQQRIVEQKIALLAANPRHPSLHVHRIKRQAADQVWECYVSTTLRLLYQQQQQTLWLLAVGKHALIDTVHVRTMRPGAASTQAAPWPT
jgi:mRNA interferase RelE/StbE